MKVSITYIPSVFAVAEWMVWKSPYQRLIATWEEL